MEYREWAIDSWEISDGICYSIVAVDGDRVRFFLFNDTNNVASYGGHGGHSISIKDFMDGKFDLKDIPSDLIAEIRLYIQAGP